MPSHVCFLLFPEVVGVVRFCGWWCAPADPVFLCRPLLASLAGARVQLRSHLDAVNGMGEGRHNGFRTDMFAFGKTLVELFGGTLNYFSGLVGDKPEDRGTEVAHGAVLRAAIATGPTLYL